MLRRWRLYLAEHVYGVLANEPREHRSTRFEEKNVRSSSKLWNSAGTCGNFGCACRRANFLTLGPIFRNLQYRCGKIAHRKLGCDEVKQGQRLERQELQDGHLEQTRQLERARSRLYRSQILQQNMRLKALAEIYTMHSFAQLCNLKNLSKISRWILQNPARLPYLKINFSEIIL